MKNNKIMLFFVLAVLVAGTVFFYAEKNTEDKNGTKTPSKQTQEPLVGENQPDRETVIKQKEQIIPSDLYVY